MLTLIYPAAFLPAPTLVAAGTARWLPYTFSSFSCSSCVESCRRDFALWFRITVVTQEDSSN